MKLEMITILYQIIHPEKVSHNLFNYKELYPLFKFHSLEPFLYHALQKGLLITTPEEKAQIEKLYQTALYKTAVQEEELNLIKQTLSSKQIPFLPIKGPWVRACYPSPELRTMADLDILVPKTALKEVKNWMLSLGYTNEHEGGNHDVYHKKPFMNVEIHRNMIAESYVLSKYYRTIWDHIQFKENTAEGYLSNEDHYIFVVAHSAKHYGSGGTGVRSVLDIYFYWKKFPNMNKEYIHQELEKLELVQYEANLCTLAEGWFDGKPLTEEATLMEEYLLSSGVYGTTTHAVISDLTCEDETKSLTYRKWKYLWKRAFPPYETMKELYPSLKTAAILLPIYYLHRLFKGLVTGKVVTQTKQLKAVSEEDLQSNQNVKKKTGVQK